MNQPSPVYPVLSLLVGTFAWVLATRGRRGDLLSPFSLVLLTLVSIFAVRPLLMIETGQFQFHGIDVISGFNEASRVGFLAVTALCAGFAWSSMSARGQPSRAPAVKKEEPEISLPRAVLIAVGLVLSWFVAMVIVGGSLSFITELYGGRTQAIRNMFANVPGVVATLPVAGALVVSFARISVERTRQLTRRERYSFWLLIFLATVPAAALGSRRYLIPCLLAALLATTLPRRQRRASVALVVGGISTFLLLAIVPFVRSAGSRRRSTDLLGAMSDYASDVGLLGTIQPVFLSYDTEMFNYVSYLAPRLGTDIPYGWGRGTVGDALLNPFPATLQPAPFWSDQLLTSIFGGGCAVVACPVPSVVGVLLYDLGIIGVLVGLFVTGILSARFPAWLESATGVRLLLVLGTGAFAPVLARGNTTNVAYIVVTTCVIAAVFLRFCRVTGRPSQPHSH